MAYILTRLGFGIGGLFFLLAFILLVSAVAGRGRWLKPIADRTSRMIVGLAEFIKSWGGAVSRMDEELNSEIAHIIALVFKAILMVLPYLGCLTLGILLVLGLPLSLTPEIWKELWSIVDGYLSEKQLGGVILMIVAIMLLNEMIGNILQSIGGFIKWSADRLSEGKLVSRQIGSASLLALFGIFGLVLTFQAPEIEERAMVRLTPSPAPTLPPPPTPTPPFDLSGQDLSGSDMIGAVLDDSNLRGVDFSGTDLHNASLLRVDLRDALLIGANLEAANLTGADLRGADLTNTNLSHAILVDTNILGVSLQNAQLAYADLSNLDLSGRDLSGINLYGASLLGANLRDTDLTGANLRYANFVGAELTNARVELVQIVSCSLLKAIMPDGTPYDGRFHTRGDDAELDYLLEFDGLDPSETLSVGDYMSHYEVSREEWWAGRAWAKDNLENLLAEADSWYAEHWPEK